jgi:hypothetical protein
MLRLDLKAAGIPYSVEGPDGPLYADFHALRHTCLALGGRAGIDLRTLQELAGHSDPKLTARYSHRRLHDLAGAFEKLPSLLPGPAETPHHEALPATGTDGQGAPTSVPFPTPEVVIPYRALTSAPDGERWRVMAAWRKKGRPSLAVTPCRERGLTAKEGRRCRLMSERATGFEPATSSVGKWTPLPSRSA